MFQPLPSNVELEIMRGWISYFFLHKASGLVLFVIRLEIFFSIGDNAIRQYSLSGTPSIRHVLQTSTTVTLSSRIKEAHT
jgi:hypothetical protein